MPAPVLAASDLALRLRAGEAAIIPTDTLPGLAVRPDQAQILWRLKRRPADKPLILMGASVNDLLHEVAVPCHREVEALAESYWPGALTLVLPARDGGAGRYLNPGGTTLGCRIPACEQARALLQISGPLATTSANRSGEPASTTAAEAARYFPDVAQLGPQPWSQHS
ncbi:MAG: L-threonylcarbamoyladenylate synthase, partial [Synechococcus sp. MOX_bin32]|nr:L-threonylcarbamoyladenylate synthase [Synechococcus sp. MOX_bin32]